MKNFNEINNPEANKEIRASLTGKFSKRGVRLIVLVLIGVLIPGYAMSVTGRAPKKTAVIKNAESFPDGIPVEYYLDNQNYFDNDEFTQNRLKIRESTRASQKDLLKAFEVLRKNGVRIVIDNFNNEECFAFITDDKSEPFGARFTPISAINVQDNFIEDLLYIANKLLVEENEGTDEIEILGIPRGFEFTVTNKARGIMSEADLQYTGRRLEAVVNKLEEYIGSIPEEEFVGEDLIIVQKHIQCLRNFANGFMEKDIEVEDFEANRKYREKVAYDKFEDDEQGLPTKVRARSRILEDTLFSIKAINNFYSDYIKYIKK